jgi:Cytochrome P450
MDMAKKFGELFLLRMGVRNLVVVSSPDLAREVLHAQGVEFGSRTRNVVLDIFTGKGQDMVFTVYGDHWRKMRRIMTVPFFTNKVFFFFILLQKVILESFGKTKKRKGDLNWILIAQGDSLLVRLVRLEMETQV